MLTPRFEISQTEVDITVTIHAPYANVRETEIFVEEEHFRFYSPPYYLRLHLPGSVEETDASSGCYDADTGKFIVRVAKVTKGEHFPDLDLLTTLLAPRKPRADVGRAGIEVLGEPCVSEDEDNEDTEDSEWFVEQTIEEPLVELTGTTTYGFAGQSSGVFARFQGELSELLDLPDPDSTPASDRWRLQVEREKTDFCEMHYLADLMEPEYVKYLVASQPAYPPDTEPLSPELQDALVQLPNREYLLSSAEKRSAYLGLVDVLFAYCYDKRVTEGETNSESAWNINKLSATLSWLQVFSSVDTLVVSCVRRSLVYPLYRSWELALAVLRDVQTLLCAGKRCVLRCLLEIHNLFNTGELRYLLNRLYVQDYCAWVQQCSATKLSSVAAAICKALPSKDGLGLELVEQEEQSQQVSVVEQEEQSQQVSVVEPGSLTTSLFQALPSKDGLGLELVEQEEQSQQVTVVEQEEQSQQVSVVEQEEQSQQVSVVEQEEQSQQVSVVEQEEQSQQVSVVEQEEQSQQVSVVEQEEQSQQVSVVKQEEQSQQVSVVEQEEQSQQVSVVEPGSLTTSLFQALPGKDGLGLELVEQEEQSQQVSVVEQEEQSQQVSVVEPGSLTTSLFQALPGKDGLGLELVELETAAILVEQEEQSQQVTVDELGDQLQQLQLAKQAASAEDALLSSGKTSSTDASSSDSSSYDSESTTSDESDSESSTLAGSDSDSRLDSDDESPAE